MTVRWGRDIDTSKGSKEERPVWPAKQNPDAPPGNLDVHVRIPQVLSANSWMVRRSDPRESSAHEAILAGKVSEMVVGALFLLPWLRRSLAARSKDQIALVACLLLVVQMLVAIYVHLQPGVPANVLPFGIKPPVVPVCVLLLGLLTAFDVWKQLRGEKTHA